MTSTYARTGPVAYLYVVGASSDPHRVTCCVPWEVDSQEIFFGPCKKGLRRHLKKTVLGDADEVVPEPDIFVVGFNALPSPKGPRSVVWAGRMNRLMTFARAADLFVGPRYAAMLAAKDSPLNVLPVRDGGRLLGYEFRPNGDHRDSDWPTDLATSKRAVVRDGDRLMLRPGVAPVQGFLRDAVFTLDNLFFANGQGLGVDAALVDILRQARPGRRGVDTLAIFGRTANGQPDGLRGRYLTISEPDLVERLVAWIQSGAARVRPELAAEDKRRSRPGAATAGPTPSAKPGRPSRRCC